MILGYPVVIKMNQEGNIHQIFCPDLNLLINPIDLSRLTRIGLINSIKIEIKSHVDNLIDNGIEIEKPNKLKFYLERSRNKSEIWTKIYINIQDDNKKIVKKILPIIGNTANIISTVCLCLTTLLALQISTGTSFGGRVKSISGAVITLIMSLIIYYYSNAGQSLSILGEWIDNKLNRNKSRLIHNQNDIPTHQQNQSWKLITTKLALGALAVSGIAIEGKANFQEITVLGEKASESDSLINPTMIFWLAWIFVITNTISLLAFRGSFVRECYSDLDNKLINNEINKQAHNLVLLGHEGEDEQNTDDRETDVLQSSDKEHYMSSHVSKSAQGDDLIELTILERDKSSLSENKSTTNTRQQRM